MNSAALLICSLEWCEPHSGKERIDFLKQRCSERTVQNVGQAVLGARAEITMMNLLSVVSIIDDDESVRESLPDLLKEFGLASQTFSSAEEFLAKDGISRSTCLILDVAMPG